MASHDPATVKRLIKDMLIYQEQLLMAGGYHAHSEFFIIYDNYIERLLKLFNLPCTPEVISQVLDYPLSPVIDINVPCSPECPHMAKMMLASYKEAVLTGTAKPFMHHSRLWSMKHKVEAIYFNLIFISETGFPELG